MTAKGPDTQVAASLKSRTKVIGKKYTNFLMYFTFLLDMQKELVLITFILSEPFNTQTPGPAEYLPAINVNRRKAPEYSLAWRTPVIERGKCSPGPIYLLPPCLGPNIPDKNTTGEVTM